jgi:hypothetical protein
MIPLLRVLYWECKKHPGQMGRKHYEEVHGLKIDLENLIWRYQNK